MTDHSTPIPTDTPGSVGQATHLPGGFGDTFTSRYVNTGKLRLHAVTGGEGPALLLLGGWPQTWYAWRLIMPTLAKSFSVVAAEPRGVGLSDKPSEGYDTGTLAADMAELMTALGHERFSMFGHDIGMWTGYALAADHPNRIERLAVAEAAIPGLSPSATIFNHREVNEKLWHFGFNRLPELNEILVRGREYDFFSHQFRTKAATPTSIPEYAIQTYVDAIAASPEALRSSFKFYRSLDETMAQNGRRKERRLTLPVLAIAGAEGLGASVKNTMTLAADDVTSVIVAGAGHYPAEEAPGATLDALTEFLAAPNPTANRDAP